MLRARSFVRKTRRGKVLRVVKEHYLRSDLVCGAAACDECEQEPRLAATSSGGGAPTYLVPDANVLLHQMDVLEHKAVDNIVFLQTVLEETRHRDPRLYRRARELLGDPARHCVVFCNEHHRSTYIERGQNESENDRNDRAIRTAAQWYAKHLADRARVVLLTNDAANRDKARGSGLECVTLREFVQSELAAEHPELMELLALTQLADKARVADGEFPEHLSVEQISAGLASGALHKGTFHVNRDFWAEAEVLVPAFALPVLIPNPLLMNRAVEGDIVAVRVLPESEWAAASADSGRTKGRKAAASGSAAAARAGSSGESRPVGAVVGIVKRNWRHYCGSLEVVDKKRGFVLFLSVNPRIPKIRIESKQIESLMDKRIVVQIDSWPRDSRFPLGHYVRTIGVIGDLDTETAVLLIEHEINTLPWSPAVLKCLPGDEYRLSEEEMARRLDLRKSRLIFSIDPPGCTDIDDALSVHELENGNLEVGVHIADVSHFVVEGSALDQAAADRSTSVYLVDRRIDMLPPRLSTDLCSLVGGQDRLAFSVFWEMDREARVLRTWFAKVLMCSAAALSYGQAQEMLDSEREDPMARGVKTLNALAKKLRQRRLEAGALTLANTEVKFLLDKESQKPMDLEMYQLKEANSLVEELMLLANVAVARHILQHFPKSALLRRHPVPPPARFESLVRAARTKGIEVKVDTSRQLADSLDAAQIPGYPYFNKLLRILTTRCLTEAVYFSAGQVEPDKYWHYGLACDTYTHFTSPIRRYADLVVHRMLACSLGLAAPSPALADSKAVATLCEHINHRDRMAALAGRASVDLYTLIFFGARGRVEDEALVVAMRADGVRVLVPRFGIEHFLRVVPREDEDDASALDVARAKAAVRFDEETLTLTTPQRVYKIFDRLRVVIYVHESKMRRRTLRVDLADAAPPAAAAATASAATPTRVSMPKRPSSAAAAPAAKGAKRPRHAASGARATGAMRDEDGDEEEEEEEKDKEEEGGGDESESDGESGTASDSGARADDELARRPAAKRGPQRQQKRRGAAV